MSQPPPAFAGAGYCPKCQGAAAKDWLAAREADLLPVGYFHLVFTLPAQIAPIAYQNKAVVYDLLFRTAAETPLTIAADPRHLGAHIGTTAVLHGCGFRRQSVAVDDEAT
jgi:Transposase zinc-binding domain